jgi:hypothetical protein
MKIQRLIPVVLLTTIILFILFGKVIFKLNSTYFSGGGDGLKSYYCAIYHAKFDKEANHFNGMNYPWGESMSFTDGQPPVANVVRYIDKHLFPCTDKMVGIFNFLMIFSILLSAVFLFLIFKKFKMPDWYATILAIGISLLSPQIGRLLGHFSLSWGFWIPLLIYLIVLILEKETWWKSILFGVVTLLASLMHMYFFLFSVALVGVCLIERLLFFFNKKELLKVAAHFTLQIILPFLLIQWIMLDNQLDRTMHPYGFFAYRAYPGSVFLPVNKWYASFVSKFHFIQNYEWESLAYVGIVASVGFWLLFVKWIITLFKKEKGKFSFTGNRELNILFWSSFVILLFSFGVPFIFGFEKIRNSIGFLSQLRAVARFSWLFYYVANVIVWIKIYQKFTAIRNRKIGIAIILVFLGILAFEAFNFSKSTTNYLNNEVSQLADSKNQLNEDKWVNDIDAKKYQAIMPLPYFHVGSESSWIEPRCDIARQMYIASLKTGLPCNGVMLGRTSLSQTYKNIELSKTPWKEFRVLNEYPNKKPLLLIVAKCDELNPDEKRLVKSALFSTATPNFDLYEMQIDTLRSIPAKYNFPTRYHNLIDSIENHIAIRKADCFINKTGNIQDDAKNLKGVKVTRKFQRIMEAPVLFGPSKTGYLRFWVKDFTKDMVVRTQLLIIQSNPDQQTLDEKYSDIFRHIKTFNGDWALIEIPLELKQPNEIIKLLIKNSVLDGKELFFDEFSVSQIGFVED